MKCVRYSVSRYRDMGYGGALACTVGDDAAQVRGEFVRRRLYRQIVAPITREIRCAMFACCARAAPVPCVVKLQRCRRLSRHVVARWEGRMLDSVAAVPSNHAQWHVIGCRIVVTRRTGYDAEE